MKEKKKLSMWLTFALILCGLQLLTSILVLVMLIMLNWAAPLIMAGIIAGFLLVFLLVFLLLFVIDWKKEKKQEAVKTGGYIRRGIGTILAALVIAGCLVATTALDKMIATLNVVTSINNKEYVNMCVFVLADDPAETVMDAKDYQFGISDTVDLEETQDAITLINEGVGGKIATESYGNVVFSMIDALYSGECQAIIMNQAYVEIVEELEQYTDFEDKTKIINYAKVEKAEEETEEEEEEEKFDITEDVFVVYISGSDTRSNYLATSRSDVNILAVVNPRTKNILLLNTPRDYFIPISIGAGANDKLTHCGLYGTHCSMDTLGNLYGIECKYYAQINFTGFETLVDALGGVDVYSDSDFTTGGKHFTVGYNTVNGEQALAFARDRHTFDDGDRARGRHQMALITAIITKMTTTPALITQYSGIMDSMQGMFSTNISTDEIAALVKMQQEDMSSWNIKSYAVTGTDASSTETYSMPNQKVYVMIPDQTTVDKACKLVKMVEEGVSILDTDVQ